MKTTHMNAAGNRETLCGKTVPGYAWGSRHYHAARCLRCRAVVTESKYATGTALVPARKTSAR